jgi:hypothetical protein
MRAIELLDFAGVERPGVRQFFAKQERREGVQLGARFQG